MSTFDYLCRGNKEERLTLHYQLLKGEVFIKSKETLFPMGHIFPKKTYFTFYSVTDNKLQRGEDKREQAALKNRSLNKSSSQRQMRSPPVESKSSSITMNNQRSRKLNVTTGKQQPSNILISKLKDDLEMSASENINKIAMTPDRKSSSKVLPPVVQT